MTSGSHAFTLNVTFLFRLAKDGAIRQPIPSSDFWHQNNILPSLSRKQFKKRNFHLAYSLCNNKRFQFEEHALYTFRLLVPPPYVTFLIQSFKLQCTPPSKTRTWRLLTWKKIKPISTNLQANKYTFKSLEISFSEIKSFCLPGRKRNPSNSCSCTVILLVHIILEAV